MLRRRRAFQPVPLLASGAHIVRLALLSAILCSSAPSNARAYEEQLSADLALGYGGLAANAQLPDQLTSIDVGAAVGMSDWLVARTAFGYAALLGDGHPVHVGRGRFELAYMLDILQWVPLLGIGGGLWALDEPSSSGLRLRPTGHLWLGLDYLASREWTVGVDVRTGALWQRGEVSSFTEAQVRFSRLFELF
jgi:hypothetical protein